MPGAQRVSSPATFHGRDKIRTTAARKIILATRVAMAVYGSLVIHAQSMLGVTGHPVTAGEWRARQERDIYSFDRTIPVDEKFSMAALTV